MIFAVAAAATVVPHGAASMTATTSSGRQRSAHVSRNVPVARTWSSAAVPQPMPSTVSRCSSTDRARPAGVRRSRVSACSSGSSFSRTARAWARRSASSGTAGAASGTAPSRSPTTRSRVTNPVACSSPSHSTASVASLTSARPASGRPRNVASASASRAASMTCAEDTGRSCARSTPATRVSQRMTVCSRVVNRWWYQPGEVIPAP